MDLLTYQQTYVTFQTLLASVKLIESVGRRMGVERSWAWRFK
jgi:hypothetical protein